jgi:hypothetical protein
VRIDSGVKCCALGIVRERCRQEFGRETHSLSMRYYDFAARVLGRNRLDVQRLFRDRPRSDNRRRSEWTPEILNDTLISQGANAL